MPDKNWYYQCHQIGVLLEPAVSPEAWSWVSLDMTTILFLNLDMDYRINHSTWKLRTTSLKDGDNTQALPSHGDVKVSWASSSPTTLSRGGILPHAV